MDTLLLTQRREEYRSSSDVIYLGNKDVLSSVHWEKDRRADVLVRGIVTEDVRERLKNGEHVTFDPAELLVVVKLTEDGFWMAPDGFFRGESIYTKTFADVKLSCLGSAPDSASPASMFTPDWAHVIANVDHLRNAIATTGSLKQGLLTASNSNSSIKMKFTHKLFEPKTSALNTDDDDNGSDSTAKTHESESEWTLNNWPVKTTEARQALDAMIEGQTHDVIPFPAYNTKGRLIPPTEYRDALQNATVAVRFSLTHYKIDDSNKEVAAVDKQASHHSSGSNSEKKTGRVKDVFATTILDMKVLLAPPPPAVSASPRKRKPPPAKYSDMSPTKKGRTSSS